MYAVDQERASNERDQFRARASPGKARHVRLLHSSEVEATEAVQPEGESHCVWKSFGYTLARVRSVVADRRDYFDRTVVVARVARGRPEHHVADVRAKARCVHAVNNLPGLLNPLCTFRKAHRADVERAVVPRARLKGQPTKRKMFVVSTKLFM